MWFFSRAGVPYFGVPGDNAGRFSHVLDSTAICAPSPRVPQFDPGPPCTECVPAVRCCEAFHIVLLVPIHLTTWSLETYEKPTCRVFRACRPYRYTHTRSGRRRQRQEHELLASAAGDVMTMKPRTGVRLATAAKTTSTGNFRHAS